MQTEERKERMEAIVGDEDRREGQRKGKMPIRYKYRGEEWRFIKG